MRGAATPAVARVALADCELAYQQAGRGPRPLVLVHGYTGSRLDFAGRVRELAACGRVLVPDLRGHGASGRGRDASGYSLEALAQDLLGFLEALDLPACDLLGHSMGGMVALRAALAQPDRFASLVLMDTAARVPDGIPREALGRAWALAREAGMEALFQAFRAFLVADPDRSAPDRRLEREWGDGYWRWRRTNLVAMDPLAYAALGQAILEQAPLLPRLPELRCPTLVLVGAEDAGFRRPADELEAGIPGARRVDVPDAAHQPQLENPEAWTRAILQHLERVRSEPLPRIAQDGGSPWPSST